ncbi:MAG: type II toxin-antitoxin system prevent-host-death family antitoxin [Planctomycetes bacterium]|nr:type II toxin-antitoxin system prevent-host-death family antitoxin [Planctomycetota bacterium]
MLKVSVTELKNKLSYYLRLVKGGETIEVLERSLPVAKLQGVAGESTEGDAHLKRLIREGIVTPGKKPDPKAVLKTPPIPCKVDPVKILIEERGDR